MLLIVDGVDLQPAMLTEDNGVLRQEFLLCFLRQPTMVVNNPLIRPYSLGGVA